MSVVIAGDNNILGSTAMTHPVAGVLVLFAVHSLWSVVVTDENLDERYFVELAPRLPEIYLPYEWPTLCV